MKKVYYTYSMKLNHSIRVKGNLMNVLFNGMLVDTKIRTFITSDADVQKALESCPAFGTEYWLGETIDEKKVDEKSNTGNSNGNAAAIFKEMEFDNVSQAKEFLHNEPYNIALNKMTSPSAIINRGKELGIEIKIKS